MAKLKLCRFPEDTVLKRRAQKVSNIDQYIQQLIDDMIATMQQSGGVGLAAPQVGIPLRIIVLQMSDEQPMAIINPEMLERSGVQLVKEGCLSVPGYYGELKRPSHVVVKGKDRKGRIIKIKAEGLMAEALDHEIDHLDGRLYIDCIESQDKLYRIT
ncbi:MAG: peptide deformylase [Dehalococcoidia bacterium]|nr:peptide deformylase [Dehalococcoidia bacterium]